MKNADVWQLYAERTDAITKTTRTLGLAAGGACWVLRPADGPLDVSLVLSLLFVVTCFAFDVAQFVVAAVWFRNFAHQEEAARRDECDGNLDGRPYVLPLGHDTWPYRLWWGKLVCLGLAWLAIVVHVVLTLVFNPKPLPSG